MEENEQTPGVRLAFSRTSQACQRCRSLKTRCLPSTNEGICQRCSTASKECVWAEVPRRARKLRAPSRIAQVEQKIDGLVASLVTTTADEVQETNTSGNACPEAAAGSHYAAPTWRPREVAAPGSWLSFSGLFGKSTTQEKVSDRPEAPNGDAVDHQFIERIRTIHNFGNNDDLTQAPEGLFQPSKRPEAPIDHDLVQQLLRDHEADALMNEYRDMSASFPFVIIHPDTSAEHLHNSKPMLLLAVLTVASWRDHKRQMKLDEIFRKELAHRTMVAPRRTLGLVQSVLVYLSWYHFVFSHKTQQIFFLHHLVIGLALDIGLHKDYQPLNFPHRPPPPTPSPEDRRERHRAFLGCYYLASMIAAGLQKPNLLQHTSYMNDWARELQHDQEYETDETIGHLVTLRQIDDQVQNTLYSVDAVKLPLNDARTLMHVRLIESQLGSWQANRRNATSQRLLDLSSSFTDLLLHNVALRPRAPGFESITNDQVQLNGLFSTMEAGKCFLDALLSFPIHEYHFISFSEWMRLPTVIMTVARLCIPTQAHAAVGWDVKAAQERVRLDLCLESLCYRMQQLTTYDKAKQPHPDFWYAMRFINDLTKSWYARKIDPISSQATPSLGQTRSDIAELTPATMSTPTTGGGIGFCPVPSENAANMDFGMSFDDRDTFAFMKDLDFDMEQFLDIGIWGDESYTGLGFGR